MLEIHDDNLKFRRLKSNLADSIETWWLHTLMSFIGCVGHIMEGLGLSGKAISRAIRGL